MNYEIMSIVTSEKLGRYNNTIKYIKQEIKDLKKINTTNVILQAKIKRDLAIYQNILKMLEVQHDGKKS